MRSTLNSTFDGKSCPIDNILIGKIITKEDEYEKAKRRRKLAYDIPCQTTLACRALSLSQMPEFLLPNISGKHIGFLREDEEKECQNCLGLIQEAKETSLFIWSIWNSFFRMNKSMEGRFSCYKRFFSKMLEIFEQEEVLSF